MNPQIPPLAALGRNDSCQVGMAVVRSDGTFVIPDGTFVIPSGGRSPEPRDLKTREEKLFMLKKVLTLSGKNFS